MIMTYKEKLQHYRDNISITNSLDENGKQISEYRVLHRWLCREYPKTGICTLCKKKSKKKNHWALKKEFSHAYNINHYMELCVSCHMKYDMTSEKAYKQTKHFIGNPTKYFLGKSGKDMPRSKPIYQIDINTGEILNEYESITQASQILKININCICGNLKGRQKRAGEYKWEYVKPNK